LGNGGGMAKSNRSGQATVLSPAQLTDLWTELDEPYRLITEIAYFTAARIGEVVSLSAADLRGERIVYRASMTKTRTTKEAVVPTQLATILAAADLPRSGYLFPSAGASGHLTTRAVDKHLRRAAALIGVDGGDEGAVLGEEVLGAENEEIGEVARDASSEIGRCLDIDPGGVTGGLGFGAEHKAHSYTSL